MYRISKTNVSCLKNKQTSISQNSSSSTSIAPSTSLQSEPLGEAAKAKVELGEKNVMHSIKTKKC